MTTTAHAEIVHRAKRRPTCSWAAQEPPDVLDGAPWVPVMRKLMGDDAINLFTGAVARGRRAAAAHGRRPPAGHTASSSRSARRTATSSSRLSMTAENRPASSGRLPRDRQGATDDGGEPGVGGYAGIIVFDYRVVHLEMANAASAARPCSTRPSRPWFRDALNFPDDALFGARAAAAAAG